MELLQELIEIPGISGYEEEVRNRVLNEIMDFGETFIDPMGNLGLVMGNGESHILLSAHLDELGLLITHIDDKGFLRFRIVGGIDERTLPCRIFLIHTKKGIVEGLIGIKPPHLMEDRSEAKKTQSVNEMFMDIGVKDRREAEKMGIEILNMATPKKDFLLRNKWITARGLDNRAGCYALIIIARELSKMKINKKITLAWTVQEEIGCRGAEAMASSIKPDFVFPIDTMSSADFPGVNPALSAAIPGNGPCLRMVDNAMMASRELADKIQKIAIKKKIRIQYSHSGGTTDGFAFQACNSKVVPVCFPVRYTHSPVETIHSDDLTSTILLCIALARSL